MTGFSIDSPDDLLKLIPIPLAELEEMATARARFYNKFPKIKPNGSVRIIYDPREPLRGAQLQIKSKILDAVPLLSCVHGGVRGHDIRDNARPHVGKRVVYSVDLKNFFPSLRPTIVSDIFSSLGFGPRIVTALAAITTFDRHVPQGAITSTGIANLALRRVDTRLYALAQRQGFSYTRWVDDLTFSGSARLLDFRNLICRIVADEGFELNPDKKFTMPAGNRQTVTGIVVNEKLNLSRDEREAIRELALHARVSRKPGNVAPSRVRGKIAWMAQINPAVGKRLERKFSCRLARRAVRAKQAL